jgi:hypothetical protein
MNNAIPPPNRISGPLLFNPTFAEITTDGYTVPPRPMDPSTPTPVPRHTPHSQNMTITAPNTLTPCRILPMDQMETEDNDDDDDDPFSNGLSQSIHAPNANTVSSYSPTTLVCPRQP